MQLTLNPGRLFNVLLLIIAILATMHIAQLSVYFWIDDSDVFDFVKMVDFDYEANLPSLYSAVVILLCASTLVLIAKSPSGHARRRHWWGLAFIFAFLGIDEATGLHEEVGDAFENLELISAEGYLYFMWVVPYAVIVLTIVATYFRFWWQLPSDTRWRFLICAALFILGAVVLETFSAAEADENGTETIYYSVLYTIEELLEMFSMAYFLKTLLTFLSRHNAELLILLSHSDQTGR